MRARAGIHQHLARFFQEDHMNRRSILKLAGGGVVLAAVGAKLGDHLAAVPPGAVAAWRGPARDTELRRWALSYALLAPNPHNLQPWLADLGIKGAVTLRFDTTRLLPATDPHSRQIVMGAGAFLELLTLAAAERGHRVQVELFPEGEPGAKLDGRPFARARFVPDAAVPKDPLFSQLLNRRTDRRAYDPARPVSESDLERLRAAVGDRPVRFGLAGLAGQATDVPQVEAIRTIAREAWRTELTTEATMMESLRLMRIGRREIEEHPDGITVASLKMLLLSKLGLVDRSKCPAPNSKATRGMMSDFDAITASTPAYAWLITEGNRRQQQVEAGRAWARLNLAGTAAGLAMHPNEQALQEYPEVAESYRAIHALLRAPSPQHTVQMLARVGYLPHGVPPEAPAPRRALFEEL